MRTVGYGMAWRGQVWLGSSGKARRVEVRQVLVGQVWFCAVGMGSICSGVFRHGMAAALRYAWFWSGPIRFGWVGRGRYGRARRDMARFGRAGVVSVGMVRSYLVHVGQRWAVWLVSVWQMCHG